MIDRTDIELDEQYALVSAGDDWVESDSSATDAELIVELQKGELRYAPWLGFGIEQRLRAVADIKKFIRELKVELENDSFKNPVVLLTQNDLSDLQIIV